MILEGQMLGEISEKLPMIRSNFLRQFLDYINTKCSCNNSHLNLPEKVFQNFTVVKLFLTLQNLLVAMASILIYAFKNTAICVDFVLSVTGMSRQDEPFTRNEL